MTHYIADVAVFGHVRGCKDRRGAGEIHYSDKRGQSGKIQDFYTTPVLGFEKIGEAYLRLCRDSGCKYRQCQPYSHNRYTAQAKKHVLHRVIPTIERI